MKANELMIGDWMNTRYGVGKVLHIGILYIVLSVEEHERMSEVDDLQPIPLTPEILEKNGFSTSRTDAYWEDKYRGESVNVEIEPWKFYVTLEKNDCALYVPLNYIHELQHAMKLCGIEKEIAI